MNGPGLMNSLQIEHLTRITISAVILLATMLLGIGERTPYLFLAAAAVVSISAYVTDFKGSFRLSQPMADCAALAVVGTAAVTALRGERLDQIFVVAHLQSYLQFVLLFQPKTPRIYWQLALLSLGQVAIASTLVLGPLFAFMLLAYMVLGIFTFALLLMQGEVRRFNGTAASQTGSPSYAAFGEIDTSARAAELFGRSSPSAATVAGLFGQVALMMAFTLGASTLLFFVLPRWDVPNREIATIDTLRSVGFSKTVTLGDLGEVVNNPDLVMRVQFFQGRENRPFKLINEPLFRGTAVTRYRGGAWTQPEPSGVVSMAVESRPSFVRQRITCEPIDVAEICSIFPVFAFQADHRLRVDNAGEHLLRQEDYRDRPLDFEVGTIGIVNDRQRRIVPRDREIRGYEVERMLQMPRNRDDQNDSLGGLREIASRVLQAAGIDPSDRVAAAHAMSQHLSSSGKYSYSLESQPRNAKLDPLEDFVTEHPRGHCEYFAGALVMMLRSQGIPARMAIGFKGGEWNAPGMYYQVQQLHAHAWVEVLLDANQIPEGEFAVNDIPPSAWLVLDPTNGVQEANSDSGGPSMFAGLRQYLDYAQVLWTNYVVALNSKRQHQGIYDPLADGAVAAFDAAFNREVWQERMRDLSTSHVGTFWDWYRRHWFSWRGGLVAAGFSLFVIASYLFARWLVGAMRRMGLVGTRRHGSEPPVLEMYRRLEVTLARQGLVRHPAQTAHEFAVAAGGDLAEHIEHRRVAHLPRRIIDVFHRVRFGGRTLDNVEAEAVEHALAELERALRGLADASPFRPPHASRFSARRALPRPMSGQIRFFERSPDDLPGRFLTQISAQS